MGKVWKVWNVNVDGMGYNIELKNNNKLVINGEELKLKNYKTKTGLIHTEYELQLGSKRALLVIMSMRAPQLVIDNRDCETGKEFVPIKFPVWSYIFVVLHCLNFLNGAIGGALAVVGVMIVMAVSSNKEMHIIIRILLNIAALVLTYGIVFGIAFVISGII